MRLTLSQTYIFIGSMYCIKQEFISSHIGYHSFIKFCGLLNHLNATKHLETICVVSFVNSIKKRRLNSFWPPPKQVKMAQAGTILAAAENVLFSNKIVVVTSQRTLTDKQATALIRL